MGNIVSILLHVFIWVGGAGLVYFFIFKSDFRSNDLRRIFLIKNKPLFASILNRRHKKNQDLTKTICKCDKRSPIKEKINNYIVIQNHYMP